MHPDKERESLLDDWVSVVRGLRAIREDLRVRSRLAALDLRDAWHALEPSFEEAEKYGQVISDATLGAMRDLLRRARHLDAALHARADGAGVLQSHGA